jgi:glycosyltransferase involved in cell wall biosynthesis
MEGRKEFLARAVECFQSQTYPNRELLIVADSIEDVRLVRGVTVLSTSQKLNIGQKRNLGCEAALNTDLIAVWDDDDYSAPGRLAQQVEELRLTSKAVTGYRSMKFTDGFAWWQFSYPRGLVLGPSLLFTWEWWTKNRFPEVQVGEEGIFCRTAAAAGQLAECPDLGLMYATIHEGNTSKRKTDGPGWVSLPGFQWK